GLKYTTAAESGVITSTTPAIVGLLAFLFLKERLTKNKIIALGLAVLGILALNLSDPAQINARGPRPWLGNLLVFGAVLGEALFINLGKAVSARVSPLAISAILTIYGLAMFLPFAVYEALTFSFSSPTLFDWLTILYYGLVVTVLAFLLW
ncbi:MAG: DMT family transporter, partial [Deltaproteobacteria bacterium]|nr:DMT family transporter [Deltaproteobacteria bacterium]